MNLYLVQHGEAVSKEVDPHRPLSENGIKNVKKAASFADKNCNINITNILHSGKLRAKQTAEVLAEALKLPLPEQADNLEPLADQSIWETRIEKCSDDLMFVGHLPYMSRLASSLLCNTPDKNIVQFQMGGIVALTRDNNKWSLQWIITPDIL